MAGPVPMGAVDLDSHSPAQSLPAPGSGILRVVNIGGALFTTTDGVTFVPFAGIPVATPSTAGLMSAIGSSGAPTLTFYSAIIDLTLVGLSVVIPPIALRLRSKGTTSWGWEIKATTACTVGPTIQCGTNTAANDYIASAVQSAFTTQAIETNISPTPVAPNPFNDLSTNGFRMNVTVGATATVLTARFWMEATLLPL